MYFKKEWLGLAMCVVCYPVIASAQDTARSTATNSESSSDDAIETMVVSAAREPVALDKVGSAISVLDEQTLTRRQLTNLGELLRSLPGIAVSRTSGVGSQTQLRVRGAEANHLKVLIDGIAVNDPGQGDEFNIAHYFNSDIEQVELLRGPQSSLWGSDALAGVVSIKTKTPEIGTRVSGFLEGGSDSYTHAGANLGWANEQSYVALTARQMETDGENVSRQGSEDDGYESDSASLRAGIWLSDNISISTVWHYLDSTTEFDSVDFATGLPTDRDNHTDARQLYGSLGLSFDALDGRWRQRLSVDLTENDNATAEEDPFGPGFTHSVADSETVKFGYESHFDLQPLHTVSVALLREEIDFSQRGEASFFGDPNRDENLETNSVVAEYRGEVADSVFVQASVRHDENSEFEDTITWRASAAWQVAEQIKLRTAIGTGVKNPTFSERFGFFTNFVGNPDLEPETSQSWEIGIDVDLGEFAAVQLTYFQAELEDEINGFVFLPSAGAFTAENESGESERQGMELSARWALADSLDLTAAYTWLEATEDEFGREVDELRRPRNSGSLELAWRAHERFDVSLRGDHNGAQDDLFFPPVPPFQERVELDGFTLVTLGGKLRISEAVSLHARVENALDEDYEEVFGFATPGRTFVLGLRVQN